MRILVIGSGGREHTLAWKLAQSPRVSQVFVAPGNGGTAQIAQNVPIAVTDIEALLAFAQEQAIDLTVVGPEAPLVAGLVDVFQAAGLPAFGPTAAAAQLEGSKAFAKQFMIEEGIPTAVAVVVDQYDAALAYTRTQHAPLVVKASGLAAGKGVFVCETLEQAEQALHTIMVERHFGSAGDQVLIEACLSGQETSLLAFCDGQTVVPMLPARDYKRAKAGDAGPNTGGMGCYAPSEMSPDLVQEVIDRVLQPTIDGMRRRGTPYVGVLYAGLMLTEDGPRVLEFNCRFGDPETQVLLPLLDSDLVELCLSSLQGRLAQTPVRWKNAHAVAVVLASGGYPGAYEKGKAITGIEVANALPETVVFHAGTRLEGEALLTSGGRVLAVTSTSSSSTQARAYAYEGVAAIHFDGVQHRPDIAAHLVDEFAPPISAIPVSAYAAAGVDIEAKSGAFRRMRAAVESTYVPSVLAGIGSFGGLFSLNALSRQSTDPVLVASTDGVGTKTVIAAATAKYDSIGYDIVNHCINDILVQGARPLLFLDYVASSQLDPDVIVRVVSSCAAACKESGCVLIGGETAEMPGVYHSGSFDLVGTIVGWVDREAIVDGRDVRPGDVCLGLPSSGLHTNGYSLARKVFADVGWDARFPGLEDTVGEALLTPHKSYLPEFEALVQAGVNVKAMAHITGGGFPDNLPRVLPQDVGVHLDTSAWEVPALFRLIQERGQVSKAEMYQVYNMGMGMVLIVDAAQVELAQNALCDLGPAPVIGKTVAWSGSGPQVVL